MPGRDAIGHGLQRSAEPGSSGLNGPAREVLANVPPTAGGAFSDATVVIAPVTPSPTVRQDLGGQDAAAQANGAD
jgi:hypothetical protein